MNRRRGRWLTGTLIFSVLFLLFTFVGEMFNDAASSRITPATSLFFCIILAYIIPIHHLIVERSLLAIDQLKESFPGEVGTLTTIQQRIKKKPGRSHAITLAVGFSAGALHNGLLLTERDLFGALPLPVTLLSIAVTMAIWIVMSSVVSSLVENAVLFNRLARQIKVNLLNVRALMPFGSVAVSSTLALIGAQAAFPVLMINSDAHWIIFVPGLIATGIPMIFLFLLPVLPVHRQIMNAKRQALDQVNRDIFLQVPATGTDDAPAYTALQPLLLYRREVAATSEWPFDTSVLGRLAFYLIIPPLTWIGAALIEILVDTAI